jgi:ABC-type glycerol-3-phosphate transport system substrate-binding protein
MKKIFTLTAALLLAAGFAFAGGGQQSAPAGGGGASAAPKEVTLTVWDFKYSEEITGAAFKKMDEMFMAANPGVKINHVAQPETNFYPMLTGAFTAKTDVDVVILHTDNRAWNLATFFEPLDPYIAGVKSNYAASALKATTDPNDGVLKGLPLTSQGSGW